MMNNEFTLLGKNVLTVGAGNIGYLTSYQLMQAGANVKAVIEALPHEGGFPVQANRVRRLGIPIILSHILLKAIPNEDHTGIIGALWLNVRILNQSQVKKKLSPELMLLIFVQGLVPDDQLLIKGKKYLAAMFMAQVTPSELGKEQAQ
jgi:hypothetical protein